MGANSTASLAGGYGLLPKAAAGLSANYRARKINVFSSLIAARRLGFSSLDLFRKFSSGGALKQAYVQDNYARIDYSSAVLNAGVDYTVSPKTTVGAAFNGASVGYTLKGDNHSEVLDASLQPASYFNTQTDNSNRWKNAGVNLSFRHTFDSLGRELSVDADAARYFANNDQNLFTQYRWLNGKEQRVPYALYGALGGATSFYVVKADYVHPLKNGLKLEAGFKSSLVGANNKPVFYDRSGGGNVYDSGKSNHFIVYSDSRTAMLTLTYRFGKRTVAPVRRRAPGSEEERRRAGGGGGGA